MAGAASASGVLTPNVTAVTCESVGVGQLSLCPAVLYTAVGGSVTIGATLGTLSGTGTAYTSISYNCTANQVLASGSSCVVYSNFDASVAGTYAAVWTPNVSAGSVSSGVTFNATVVSSGYLTSNTTGSALPLCPNSAIGTASTCSSGVTFTAVGGSVTLASVPFTSSVWGPFDFYLTAGGGWYTSTAAVTLNTCTAGLTLTAGTSCSTGPIKETPIGTGYNYAGFNVQTTAGAGASIYMGMSGATGTNPSILAVTPNPVTCPNTPVGTPVTCGTIEITAGAAIAFGASPYTFTDPEFTIATTGDTCRSTSQAATANCTTGVITFTPTSSGAKNSTLTVTPTSGTSGTTSISGTGTAGTLVFSPTTENCGTYPINGSPASTACPVLTLTATGGPVTLGATPLSLSGTNPGDFSLASTTCTANLALASGASCTITPSYNPSSSGVNTQYANIVAATSIGTGATLTNMQGTGRFGVANTTPTAVTCGTTTVGSAITCGTVAVSSDGTVYLASGTNAQLVVSGTNASDFSITDNTCVSGANITPASGCTTGQVSFNPSASGTRTATITVTASAGTSAAFTVTGTGTSYPTVSPSSHSCGTAGIGVSTACSTYTVTANAGSVTFGASPFTHTDGTDFSASGCTSLTLTSGQTCTVSVSFDPTVAGALSDTLTITPTTGGAATVALTGTGAYGSLVASPTSLTCGTVTEGSSGNCGTVTLTATNGSVVLGATPLSNSNAPNFATPVGTCTASSTLANGASCTTGTVTLNPVAYGALTDTVSVAATSGTGTTFTVSGTGGYGVATVSVTGVTCSGAIGVAASCTGTATISASGASVILAATPVSLSGANAADFAVGAGACASATVAKNASCNLGVISFTPTATSESLTLNAVPSSGTAGTAATLTGTASYGTAAVSVTGVSCTSGIGVASSCSGTAKIAATGGAVILSATPVTVAGTNAADFSVAPGACASATVASGSSCNLGTITFTPSTTSESATLAAVVASGTAGSATTLTGTGTYGTATVSVTGVTCTSGIGVASSCSGTAKIAATSGAVILSATPVTVGGTNAADFSVAAGACAGATLASGASCNLGTISFTLSTASESAALSASVASGTAGTATTLTGAGTYGSLSASVSSLSCGTDTDGSTLSCGTLTFTASGGAVVLSATPLSLTDSADFSISNGTCTAGATIASGASCTSGAVSFDPASTGAHSTTITINTASGTGTSASASGTGYTYTWTAGGFGTCSGGSGTWNYSAWTPTSGCGTNLPQTRTGSCVANAGTGSASQSVTCTRNDGTTVANTFCSGTANASSESCTPTTGFSCGTEGALSQTFNDTSTCTYSWSAGSWSAPSSTCSPTATETRSVTCLQSDGTTVASSFCSGAGAEPATSQTVSSLAGCTFSWSQSGYGACSGGTASWQYTSWTPTTGCGTGLTQTRTGSCVQTANSGTATQAVTCLRSDGTTVDNSQCSGAGTEPATSEACTPTSASCGTEGALSQTFNDTSTCTYSWSAGSWSAPSSTCSTTATETRSVTCLQSDGSTVDNSLCAGAGSEPATSQSVSSLTGCSFSWQASGFATCTGGTGTWNYSAWTPASGCGATTQSRTGTCVADATSAAQSQTVTCLRSDGTTVDNSQCSGAGVEPATSQSCTPTSGYSCGTEGALTQPTTLTDTCTYIWTAGSWSASSNTCSSDATQTRTVSCTRSDGTTVDSSLCAETGAAPASSQTVADYSSCTYNWTQSGFGICSGGTGTWNYSSWAPTTGCGTNLTQTRSGTCVANTNSVTQTQTVLCQRSDGSTVDNSFCTTTEPATSQTCTPTVDFSCGPQGALSQSFSDTSLCGYTWASSAWSASANTCADATTQTRTVSCLQSDGTTVANSFCVDAGAQPAATQTVSDFSTCTYSYVDGAYGACTGGTGTWVYGSWAPTSGCGTNLTQTRSGTCVADAGSSSQSRTVSCTRSNGDVVDASFCAGQTADPTSASCTPSSGYSCGTEGSLSQSFSDTSTCSYGWTSSAWSVPSSSCSATATETRTNSCERSDGTIVDDSLCTGAAPATTQSVAIYSGCTFNWVGEGFGACSGGTGTWNYSSWTPATGCGTTAQTRTGTCVADANSSVQTQTVICQRSDGTTVAGTNCTGTAPATSQACTPSDSFSCGTEASLTQSVSLTNSCSYSWQTSAWSAPSSSCSTAATETRSVTCEQSDGTTVADGLCSGAGAKPATSQTLSVLTGCTFNWNASGFGACTGGSASWQYSSWTPTAGCGTFTQTRTGSCVQTANSGSATQTVTCERSDGTPVDASNCTGSAPATSEACTPTSASCGTEGALSQSATDTSLCGYTWATTAWSAPSSSCSDTATESRTVSCQQSDGETVANSFCVDAGAQPSASQYVPTYSGCGTLAFSTSSVSCPATGAGTSASCTSVTLTANGGPVQLGATALSSTDSTDFTIAGGCTSDLQLAAGASCSIAVITNPAAVGATSATVTANVNGQLGTGGASFSISGSGTYGYAVATPSTQLCQSQGLGTGLEQCENFATITATNGPIVLASASPFTNSDPEFSVYGGTCSAGTSLAVNQSCTYEGAFNGTSIGEKSDTVTVATSQGTGTSFVLTAAVGYGIVTINPTSLACGSETAGQTTSCGAGSVTVTATAGEVIFDANPFSLNDNTDFTVAAGTCANATLAIGQSCTSGAIAFSPVSAGAKASTVTVTPNFGTSGTFSLSGTGVYGYSWQAGGFGSCTGGSGTWGYSSWTPTTGCGVSSQSRTGTCSVTAGSGTQTQSVSCVRTDGTTVANSFCTGAAPSSSQSCTPATASCGTEGALTQSATLTNACSYNWVVGTAGACTGGSASWSYTAWTPAAGSHCTTQLAQTRSGTCTPVANSGTASASVSCQDQAGNVVANSNCTGTAPSGTGACTPSSGYSCGTEGSLAQTVSDLSSCSYSWTSGAWGTCSGGTGSWAYSGWTPTCGIGPTTQTRTGTCVAATNGGSQSRVVACSRSDGTVMANSYCTGSAPAVTGTCTATTGFSCGTEGVLSQKVTLTNKCQ
jgi:hypothetical protein